MLTPWVYDDGDRRVMTNDYAWLAWKHKDTRPLHTKNMGPTAHIGRFVWNYIAGWYGPVADRKSPDAQGTTKQEDARRSDAKDTET